MTHAIRIHKTGGPEVLSWEEVQLGKPGPGEARIRHTAVGLNFVDVYNRMGLYPQPLPSGLGGEGAGVVEDIGTGVTEVKPGDRVAYTGGPLGAYSEARLIPAERLVVLPKGISDHQAAAMMLKGLTAQYLIRHTYRVKTGDTILVHAAAGGVGQIALSMGEVSWRHGHRHGRERREDELAKAWLRSRDRHLERELPDACARSRTATVCRWSTRRRQGHLHELARLPGARSAS